MVHGKRTKYVRDLPDVMLVDLVRSYSLRLRNLINEYWVVLDSVGLSLSEAQAVLCEVSGLNGQLISLLREAQRRKLVVKEVVPSADQNRDPFESESLE